MFSSGVHGRDQTFVFEVFSTVLSFYTENPLFRFQLNDFFFFFTVLVLLLVFLKLKSCEFRFNSI